MEKLYSNKLSVTIIPPATAYDPVDKRKYTLTGPNEDGIRFLAIGYKYEMSLVNAKMEDMLTAEWKPKLGEYLLAGKVYVSGGEHDQHSAKERYMELQAELPGAISMMIHGDRDLYKHVPWLLDAPIYIEFDSTYNQYRTIQYAGTPRQYLSKLR